MRRREFIKVIAGSAAWPLAARAQQPERMRHIAIIMGVDNADNRASYAAFLQALQQLGWIDGSNVKIETRWARGNASDFRKYATDIVALAPDVIVATGTAAMVPLLQATHTVPIVFVSVADPVGACFVDTMAHPGGNATGFIQFEYSLSGKWLELLKEIAPAVTRVAVIRDPSISTSIGQFAVIQSVAPSLGVDVRPVNLKVPSEVERTVSAFAKPPNGGLIITAGGITFREREFLAALA